MPAFRAATPFAISKASVGLPTSASLVSRLAADDARAKLAPYLAFNARAASIARIACPNALAWTPSREKSGPNGIDDVRCVTTLYGLRLRSGRSKSAPRDANA